MPLNPHTVQAQQALKDFSADALVHATLAVAYAQDTANLIEFFRLIETQLSEESANDLIETISERMPFSLYTTLKES